MAEATQLTKAVVERRLACSEILGRDEDPNYAYTMCMHRELLATWKALYGLLSAKDNGANLDEEYDDTGEIDALWADARAALPTGYGGK